MRLSLCVVAFCALILVGGTDPAAAEGTLIVLNKAEASASFIDLARGEEVAKLPTGDGPHEAAVSPDGRTAVVCDYGGQAEGGTSLTVLDVPSAKVVRTIDLGKYYRPHGIEYFDDGERVVVTCEGQQALVVVDVTRSEVVSATRTDAAVSHMVAMSPDETRAYVANIGSGSVSVIDLEEGTLVTEIETGDGAEAIDVSPDGEEVWVGNRGSDTLSIIDTGSNEVVATLECASFPIRAKFTPDGERVLVSNARSGELVVFDAKARKEIGRISMDESAVDDKDQRLFSDRFGDSPVPVGILVHPDGKRAFVANTNADVVTEIDLDRLVITRRLKAGTEPDGLAYSPLDVSLSQN